MKIHLLILLAGLSLPVISQNAWINELHYDDANASGDLNEMVEVVVENPSGYDLSLFSVVLYNGASTVRTPYDTKTLDMFTTGSTVGNFTMYYYIYPTNGIQNGDPDGLALAYDNVLIPGQFLSYEGTFVAASGVASGQAAVDIGVAESNTTPVGYSLQLTGTGNQYAAFTWTDPASATPGQPNNGQVLNGDGVNNPINFMASTASSTQIDLSWIKNSNADDVMIAWSTVNTFGNPSGSYSPGDMIPGGGTVLYTGQDEFISHMDRTPATTYYYKGWSVDPLIAYSPGVVASASTQFDEPTSHPTGLAAVSNGPSHIHVSWTDADAAHYLVKGSDAGYNQIVPPVDGVSQGDSLLVKNVAASVQSHQFINLTPGTSYFFKIYPYNGAGEAVNYKTDGVVPETMATTDELDLRLIISEVADPLDSAFAKFVEITNIGQGTIDFSTTVVYLCRQADGGNWASVQLTGTLNAGASHVVSYQTTRFLNAYGFDAQQNSGSVSGNGNDGYFLYYNGNQSSGSLLDAYGVMNENGTGKPWFYGDRHAVRKRNVAGPNVAWDISEWVILSAKASDMTPGFHNGDITWLGASSGNWNEKGGNWNSPYGYIPDASSIVTIPTAPNYPVVTGPSACHQVMIQSGTSLSVQDTGTLQVVGE